MHFLITNDDGIFAPGIAAMAEAVSLIPGATYTIVAPSSERSQCGHSLTTHHLLTLVQEAENRYHSDGTPADCVRIGLFALGIKPDQDYGASEVTLDEGDVLVVFSDGITEAQDVSQSLYSEQRLEACLVEIVPDSAGDVATEVIDRVMQFQGEAPQADDITILTMQYTAAVPAESLV